MESNFFSYSHYPVDSLDEPYDLFSIMHYDNKAFSGNGQDTMQSKTNPYLRFGKVRSLSVVDIKQLMKLYSCSPRSKPKGKKHIILLIHRINFKLSRFLKMRNGQKPGSANCGDITILFLLWIGAKMTQFNILI